MSAEPVARAAPDREYAEVGAALFWLWGLALIIPVWMGLHFPTEDGLAHLHWVDVYRELGVAGNASAEFYERSIRWNTPNLSYFALHYALSAVVDSHVAQQIVISLLILGWVAAVHVLSVSARGALTLGALASLLLIHSSWLYGGYLTFLVGVPILLLSVAVLVRAVRSGESASRTRSYFLLALLGVIAYYSHFVVAGLFLFVILLAIVFYGRSVPSLTRPLAIAALPTGVLILSYLLGGSSFGPGSIRWEPMRKTVARFVGLAFFRGFARADLVFWLALALAGAIFLALCWSALVTYRGGARKLPTAGRFLLLVAGGLVVLYFVSPDGVGQGYNLKGRIQLMMWAWLLPSLPYAMRDGSRRALLAGICVLLGWQVADFSLRARRFNREYAGVLEQAKALPVGATLKSVVTYENAGFDGSFIRVLAQSPEDIAGHCRCVLIEGYHPSATFYWVRALANRRSADYLIAYEPQRSGSPLALTIRASQGVAGKAR